MADSDGTAPETTEGEPLAERVGKVEAEQQRQGGVLDQILERLPGKDPKASPSSSSSSETEPGTGPSIEELVRQGVEKIEAEKQRKADEEAAAGAADARLKAIEDRLPERKPAEVVPGRKAKLQQRMFGKADAR